MITMCMDKNCVDDAASLFWAVYLLWAHVLNRNIQYMFEPEKKGLISNGYEWKICRFV